MDYIRASASVLKYLISLARIQIYGLKCSIFRKRTQSTRQHLRSADLSNLVSQRKQRCPITVQHVLNILQLIFCGKLFSVVLLACSYPLSTSTCWLPLSPIHNLQVPHF